MPSAPGTRKPEFAFRNMVTKLEANGEQACKRAFYVALVMAIGRFVIWPLVLLIVLSQMSDPASLLPILRKGLSYIHIAYSSSP
jgi:hypothetical protein